MQKSKRGIAETTRTSWNIKQNRLFLAGGRISSRYLSRSSDGACALLRAGSFCNSFTHGCICTLISWPFVREISFDGRSPIISSLPFPPLSPYPSPARCSGMGYPAPVSLPKKMKLAISIKSKYADNIKVAKGASASAHFFANGSI